VLLCCRMYIPDLPTYLVFYLETTRGSSIDTPMTPTPTQVKSLYIPDSSEPFEMKIPSKPSKKPYHFQSSMN
jgi:hypothetical protein